MKPMPTTWKKTLATAATITWMGLGCAGSPSEAPGAPVTVKAQAASKKPTPPPPHDDVSAPPVSIHWTETPASQNGNVLSADVVNTTTQAVKASISINAESPDGDLLSVDHGMRTLQPNSSTTINIPVAKLPVQSVGAATTVTLVATYDGAAGPDLRGDGKAAKAGSRQTSSDARYVTFDDTSFKSARARNRADQARENGKMIKNKQSIRAVALRKRDAKTGAMQAQDLNADRPGNAKGMQIVQLDAADGPEVPTN